MSLIYTVLSLAVTGSVMYLAVRMLQRILRRGLPQWAVYLMYVVVIMRMLIPFSPSFSLMQKIYDSGTQTAPTAASEAHEPQFGEAQMITQTLPDSGAQSGTISPSVQEEDDAEKPQKGFPWTGLLFAVWLSGAIIMLTRTVAGYALFRRRINKSGRSVKINGFDALPVMITGEVDSPMMTGVFRPVVLLPERDIPEWQLRYTLIHETAHCRRGDILVKWAVEICRAVYWFDPLMGMMSRDISEACERACDEYVVRDMTAEQRSEYARTLVESAAAKAAAKRESCSLATAMTAGASRLKERLEDMMKYRKTTARGAWMSIVAVTLLAAAGLLLGACAQSAAESDEAVSYTDIEVSEEHPFAVMYYNFYRDGVPAAKEVMDYEVIVRFVSLLTPDESWYEYEKSGADSMGMPIYDVALQGDEFGTPRLSFCGRWFFECNFERDDLDIYISVPDEDKFKLPEFRCYRMPEESHRQLMELLGEMEKQAAEIPERTASELLELWSKDPHLNLTVYSQGAYHQALPVKNEGGAEEILAIIGDTEKWTEITYEEYLSYKPSPGAVLSGYPGGQEQILFTNGPGHYLASVGTWEKKYYVTEREIYSSLKRYAVENAVYVSQVTDPNAIALLEEDAAQ